MIRSVVQLAKREAKASVKRSTSNMQTRSFGGAMGVKKSGHVEQWNNLREDTHKVSNSLFLSLSHTHTQLYIL